MSVPVVSIGQMREWEQATWETGQTETEVIRQVGQCLAQEALRLTHPDDLVLILAGKGHNGDDARCAREHLPERRVEVLDVTEPGRDLPKLEAHLASRPALIIDGLFGVGLNRPLSRAWVQLIERLNQAQGRILAVDVPSGLNAETGETQGAAARAAVTLTVGAPKKGMLCEAAWPFVGRLEVASEVGLAPCPLASDVQWTVAEDFGNYPLPRPVATHKGSYGHLGIIAGSLGYHGAAVLAAHGAQRAQPGLITLHTMETVYSVVAPQMQAVMVSPWQAANKMPGAHTALLIGPGLAAASVVDELKVLVRQLWQESPQPIVVDASALDWLPSGAVSKAALRVITPHPGEAARLLRSTAKQVQANRFDALRQLSQRFGDTWVVLKGHQTLVGRSSGEIFVNSSGNPYLAQGGSGDVLSGFLAGLLTQPELQEDPLKAIRYAVWEHGAAADHLQAIRPGWVIEDLHEVLGGIRA